MTIVLDGTSGITTPSYGGTDTAEYLVPVTSFKNRIINGAMMIDQRNAGASVTPTNGQYLVDRFFAGLTQASKFTVQQNAGSVTPPVGFTNYLGCTSSSAYAVAAGDIFYIQQRVEGLNIADLAWGTANAKAVTLSFWVYSSLTGTFGGALNNSSFNQCYPFSYSIPVANTWTQISITIAGATSGTWTYTNAGYLCVDFSLGGGSTYSGTAGAWTSAGTYYTTTGATSVVGTNGATFYITGVQLEKGSTATSFDYRPYGTELALCQRYGYSNPSIAAGSTQYNSNYSIGYSVTHPVQMRTTPSLLNASTWTIQGVTGNASNVVFSANHNFYTIAWTGTNSVPNTNFGSYVCSCNQSNTFVSAEL